MSDTPEKPQTDTTQAAPQLPPRPEPPNPDDCCMSGCSPCVYDTYDQELERWHALIAELKSAGGNPSGG
ncbi:MAG: oxidoreductase-like domain-containing protein [Nevskiales bacterium]|nr:oxidoreductase-like domain-containing protein [Nevskiales bacterium]